MTPSHSRAGTSPSALTVQAEVNKKVRDHYRSICGRDLPVAEIDMSSPELITAASDLGIPLGPDGRLVRTDNDPASRSGHKSGTPKRSERGFIGFETTKVVATCSHTYDPKTGSVTLGPAVSPYVLASRLSKANENVGPIGADLLPRALQRATNVVHVLAAGGITQKKDSFNITAIEPGLQLHRTYDATHVYGGGDIIDIVVGKEKKKTHTVKAHCGEMFHINTPKRCLTPPDGYFTLDEKPPNDKDETDNEREAEKHATNSEPRREPNGSPNGAAGSTTSTSASTTDDCSSSARSTPASCGATKYRPHPSSATAPSSWYCPQAPPSAATEPSYRRGRISSESATKNPRTSRPNTSRCTPNASPSRDASAPTRKTERTRRARAGPPGSNPTPSRH